ncbi:hypothetical protein [Burkholderia singularis]|uniref:hypothetical protein n=1 Tax=Burkholderia singularis TaxID=1503053 RepID=UPI00159ED0F0|nr:hypothetical protein [Burkholderia singularis]
MTSDQAPGVGERRGKHASKKRERCAGGHDRAHAAWAACCDDGGGLRAHDREDKAAENVTLQIYNKAAEQAAMAWFSHTSDYCCRYDAFCFLSTDQGLRFFSTLQQCMFELGIFP